MQGVYYCTARGMWRAAYSNKLKGIDKLEVMTATKVEAVRWRLAQEDKYGIPRIGRPLAGKDTNRSNS